MGTPRSHLPGAALKNYQTPQRLVAQCETPPRPRTPTRPAMRALTEKTLALEEWQQRIVFWGGAMATGAVAVVFAKASDAAMLAFETARQWLPWWPYCA